MRHTMCVQRALLAAVAVLSAGLIPGVAQGQLAVQTANISFLVLPPVPAVATDTAYAVQLGDAIRKKVDGKLRLKLRVTTKEKIVEALSNSGFPPDAILDDNGAIQLGRFMNVDAYLWGNLERAADKTPSLRLRLVENRRSGLSGWFTVKGPGKDVDDFASMVADSVDIQVKAAEQARECLDRRDKKDYGSAIERASRAFKISPNHPQAALCLAAILEITKAPLDSQMAMYRRAAAGDPMLTRAWDGLAGVARAKNDTAAWADALIQYVEVNPTDMTKRFAAVELLYRTKQYARSVQLLNEALQRNPGDNGSISLKGRSCFDGQLWACAVEALGERFDADTALQKDSLYLSKIWASASAANDPATVAAAPAYAKGYYRVAPDNAAIEKWTGVAVQKFPNSITFWRRRAGILSTNGKTDEALDAYRHVAQLDQNDFASRIQIGKILSERAGVVFDSLGKVTDALTASKDTVQLKALGPQIEATATTAWASSDAALSDAVRVATPDTRVNVGALIFQPATKLAGKKNAPNLSIAMLEKALPLVAGNDQLVKQANFFLGLSYLYKIQTVDFKEITKNKDCSGVADVLYIASHGKEAILAGASIQPATAQTLAGIFSNLEKQLTPAKTAWKCK